MKLCAAVLCIASFALAKHEKYEGYKSYYVSVSMRSQQLEMATLAELLRLDVLSPPLLDREGVVLVSPQQQRPFMQALYAAAIGFRVHSDDVKAALEYEDMENEISKANSKIRNGGRNIPYDNYQELYVIDEFMQDIANRYHDSVKLVHAGDSFEGRPIKYLKISSTNFRDTSKPVIFIDGGIHAREWISPATVTWAIHKLVEDITEHDLYNNVDWIILPVVNPDGYVHTHTVDRYWRKTLSRHGTLGNDCPGVDANRNYDFAWNTVGTSQNQCSDIYAGPKAFSEPETRVVRDIVMEFVKRMPLYLTMHSYGSMILYPWGHNGTLSPNALNLNRIGVAMAQAIDPLQDASFPKYEVGNSAVVVGYAAAGASEDWTHSLGVPLSYTCELPGLTGGVEEGFHLPPVYIQRVCQETWAGIVVGVRMAVEMYTFGNK